MRRSDSNEGFALAALIIFMTALSIVLAASLPVYQVQAQRELEEELIFRGQEYVRAIQKYQRQFGIFPPSIDALIDTNGIRYLRRPYIDPITGEGFRLLTVNPDGTINGSTLLQAGANPALFQGGTPQMFGAPGSGQGEGGNGRGRGAGGNFQGTSGFGQQQGFGAAGSGQTNFGQAATPNAGGFGGAAGFGQQGGRGGQAGAGQTNFGQAIAPNAGGFNQPAGGRGGGFGRQGRGNAGGGFPGRGAGPGQGPGQGQGGGTGQRGPTTGGSQTFGGGGVVGVAPENEGRSLKAYNQRETYSEWEFIAIPGFGTVPSAAALPGQGTGQPAEFQDDPSSPFSGGQPNPFD